MRRDHLEKFALRTLDFSKKKGLLAADMQAAEGFIPWLREKGFGLPAVSTGP